jgi:hypothetical protein
MAEPDYLAIKYWPGDDYHLDLEYQDASGQTVDVSTDYTGEFFVYGGDTLLQTIPAETSSGIFQIHATYEETQAWADDGATDFRFQATITVGEGVEKKTLVYGPLLERKRYGQT